MKKNEYRRKDKAKFSFDGSDFYNLLEQCKSNCSLTGRQLTALNVEVELREPYKAEDIEAIENHYLVDRSISYLARHIDETDIIDLAAEIIEYRGLEKGYKLIKAKKAKRK
ncbi:hypothetical protein [Leptospira alexanderi]|uniref:hypothetical protein n=1 Tax=Leptospira alexanderi TaxID=100053 RepID=UPI000990CCFC|nr:hypothetical protein [Leptospira alexanderi]